MVFKEIQLNNFNAFIRKNQAFAHFFRAFIHLLPICFFWNVSLNKNKSYPGCLIN